MNKRIRINFTQQSKQTVADTTLEYELSEEDLSNEKYLNERILEEAEQLQIKAQSKASLMTMRTL